MITHVKIYGERNTGTTFVRSLLNRNFDFEMLAGNVQGDETPEDRKEIARDLREYDWLIKMIVFDRMSAMANEKVLPETLGWKHMSPPVELIRSMPGRTANTLFVVVVKHPVFWALSFYRHPYHSFIRPKGMTFSEFLRKVYVCGGRDNVETAMFESFIGVYAAKVDGYRRLSQLDVPFELVRYEDLLTDIPGFLARMESKFGLARSRKREFVLGQSTKGDDIDLEGFKEKYRLENVRTAVSPEDYTLIMDHLGRERLAWLGYPET